MQSVRGGVLFTISALLITQTVIAQGGMFGGFKERKEKAVAELRKFTKPDTARANALLNVARTAYFLKQEEEVKPYHDEALVLCRRLNYTKGLARCYLFMGNYYKSAGNSTTAIGYLDSLIQICREPVDSEMLELRAIGYRWKAIIYYNQENYYEALPNFFEALKYYDYDVGNATLYIYTDIADIYGKLNNLDQAVFYAAKNATLAENGFPKMFKAEAYLSLVDVYIQRNDLQLALAYLDKMKSYMPDSLETILDFGYYACRGRISYMMEQYDSSFDYYHEAYKYAVASQHKGNVNNALDFLAITALKLGKLEIARKYAEENLESAQEINSKSGEVSALVNLSQYYHQIGNQRKAFDLLQRATTLKDSMLSETNIRQANTLAAIYQTRKKENEISQLQSEKRVQIAAVEKKANLNRIFILTIIGLLVLGALAYRTITNERKIAHQRQEIQKQKISELEKDKQLSTVDAMLKGQEEERSRIAKDLHDGLGGMLFGVKISMANIKENIILSDADQRGFDRSLSMLDTTISELRKVAHNLMPETLVRFGLNEAVKDFCNSIATSTGVKIIYQQMGENRKLSSRAEITIYRIVQELVNNAVKHAEARQIIVQLTKTNTKIEITVEDDGKGFDSGNPEIKRGAGLSNIRYRVNYFKGAIDINSQPGNGTSVNIELIA